MRRPIAADSPPIDRPLARYAGTTIFLSRWLQAPLYLGLIAAQGVYVWRFMQVLRTVSEGSAISQWGPGCRWSRRARR